MLTMAPPDLRAKAWRAKAWERKKTALRFTSITASQSASVKSIGVGAADDAGVVHQDVERAEGEEGVGGGLGVVEGELEGAGLEAAGGDEVEGLVERGAAGGDDLGAGLGHGDGDGLADAGVGAGDERGLAVEAEGVGHRRASMATMSMSL